MRTFPQSETSEQPCIRAYKVGEIIVLMVFWSLTSKCAPLKSFPICRAVAKLPWLHCPSGGGGTGGHMGAWCEVVGKTWSHSGVFFSPIFLSYVAHPPSASTHSLYSYFPGSVPCRVLQDLVFTQYWLCPIFWAGPKQSRLCEAITMRWGLLSWVKSKLKQECNLLPEYGRRV